MNIFSLRNVEAEFSECTTYDLYDRRARGVIRCFYYRLHSRTGNTRDRRISITDDGSARRVYSRAGFTFRLHICFPIGKNIRVSVTCARFIFKRYKYESGAFNGLVSLLYMEFPILASRLTRPSKESVRD